jgi:hypothetical protein
MPPNVSKRLEDPFINQRPAGTPMCRMKAVTTYDAGGRLMAILITGGEQPRE